MTRKIIRSLLAGVLIILAAGVMALGGYLFWRDHRPQPASIREMLFRGITYFRDVRQAPSH